MKRKHAKKGATKEIDANLLGPCGFYCGYCLAFKLGECLGCRYQADEKLRRGRGVFCSTLDCSEKMGVAMCSDCERYPCDEEYDPATNIFSAVYIDYIKNDVKPAARRRLAKKRNG